MTGLMDAWLLAARIRLHADIDHACALELQRAREHAESARRSIGQLSRWARADLVRRPLP